MKEPNGLGDDFIASVRSLHKDNMDEILERQYQDLSADLELLRELEELKIQGDESLDPVVDAEVEEHDNKPPFSISLSNESGNSFLTVTEKACSLKFQISRRSEILWRLFLLLEDSAVVYEFIDHHARESGQSMTCLSGKAHTRPNFESVMRLQKSRNSEKMTMFCRATPQNDFTVFEVNSPGKIECSGDDCRGVCLEASERNESWRILAGLLASLKNAIFSREFRFSALLSRWVTREKTNSVTTRRKLVLGGECGIVAPSSGDTTLDISYIDGVCPKLEDLNGTYIADLSEDQQALTMNEINSPIGPIYRIHCPGNIRYYFISNIEDVEANIGPTQRALICRRAQAAVTL